MTCASQGDVGGYDGKAPDARFPASKSEVEVDRAGCEPLAHALTGLAPGGSAGGARAMATEQKSPTDTAPSPCGT
ncbi:hypothetical protein [Streptomyces sp. NPDC047706]|uniref:hypothetical protein n=1 Tax=Streptomyces sp. NPDC047706 TaxID=3365486 RepID=UPI00371837E0